MRLVSHTPNNRRQEQETDMDSITEPQDPRAEVEVDADAPVVASTAIDWQRRRRSPA